MIKIESRLSLRSYEEKTGAAVHLQVDASTNVQICAEILGILKSLEDRFPMELMAAMNSIVEGVIEDENN